MQQVRLGAAGPATSRLGLGCRSFSDGHGPLDVCEAEALIGHAVESGVVLIDAADPSPDGDGLHLIGRVVNPRRDDVLLAAHGWPAVEHPEASIRAFNTSLRRLDVDHVDLYYVHPSSAEPASAVPIEERIGALANLVEAGRIRYLGVYDANEADLLRAHAVHPITALAVEYSLAARQIEENRLPLARSLNIGVVACRPLAHGLLTGRLADPHLERSPLLSGLRVAAAELDIGVSRLALAWLLSRGDDVIPIPGTGSRVHLEMNVLSADIALPPEVMERLSKLSDGETAAG